MQNAEEHNFEDEANPSLMVSNGVVYTDLSKDSELSQQNLSPNGSKFSPSFTEITKKKPMESSSS